MNYIYDIYLNFKEIPFDFYDWNKNDEIIHIKKIPIFLISVDNFHKIMTNNIKLGEKFIKYVHNHTELYKKDTKKISCALFTDKRSIIALIFNDKGESFRRSFLVIDEELEILDNIDDLDETKIDFNTLDKIKYYTETKKQMKIKEYINYELKKCNIEKLKYIYFECFNKYEDDINKIITSIKNSIKDNYNCQKIYNVFSLTSTNKK